MRWARRRRAAMTAVVIACCVLVALDSGRVPYFDMGWLYWIIAAAYVLALVSNRAVAFRTATALLVGVSLLRAVLYLWNDGRIAPIGLDGLIAVGMTATYINRDRRVER